MAIERTLPFDHNTHNLKEARRYELAAIRLSRPLRETHTRILHEFLEQYDELTRPQLDALNAAIAEEINAVYDGSIESVNEVVTNVAAKEVNWNVKSLKSYTSAPVVHPLYTSVAREVRKRPYHGRTFDKWYKRAGVKSSKRITGLMSNAWSQGLSAKEANSLILGAMRGSESNFKTLTRSYMQHMSAGARDEVFKNNDDIIKHKQWLSTLDNRTTPHICGVRDGKKYDSDNNPIGHNLPWDGGPGIIHWNCRSTAIPVLKKGLETERPSIEPGSNYKKGDKTTRTGRVRKANKANRENRKLKVGRVKSTTDYETWLRKVGKENISYVEDALGSRKRAVQFMRGKSLRQIRPHKLRSQDVAAMAKHKLTKREIILPTDSDELKALRKQLISLRETGKGGTTEAKRIMRQIDKLVKQKPAPPPPPPPTPKKKVKTYRGKQKKTPPKKKVSKKGPKLTKREIVLPDDSDELKALRQKLTELRLSGDGTTAEANKVRREIDKLVKQKGKLPKAPPKKTVSKDQLWADRPDPEIDARQSFKIQSNFVNSAYEGFEDSHEHIKSFWLPNTADTSYFDHRDLGGAFYARGLNAIHMGKKYTASAGKKLKGNRYSKSVYRHEHGHYMDHKIGRAKIVQMEADTKKGRSYIKDWTTDGDGEVVGTYVSSSKPAQSAMNLDTKRLDKMSKDFVKRHGSTSTSQSLIDDLSIVERRKFFADKGLKPSTIEFHQYLHSEAGHQAILDHVSDSIEKALKAHKYSAAEKTLAREGLKSLGEISTSKFDARSLFTYQKIVEEKAWHELPSLTKFIHPVDAGEHRFFLADDYIGALTKERWGSGHGTEYYNSRMVGNINAGGGTEAFANANALLGDDLGEAMLEVYGPNYYKWFKDELKWSIKNPEVIQLH